MGIQNNVKGIYNFCPYLSYSNDQILKDCCLIPYMFHQKLGYRAVIVMAGEEGNQVSYPNLEKVPELKIEYLDKPKNVQNRVICKPWADICCAYLKEHYREIDVLFCFGVYPVYTDIVPFYKQLRPDGEVILKLDANISWLEKIEYENREFREMLRNCDIITCESKRMKKYISAKWPYKIDYLLNGTPDFVKNQPAGFEEKDNVILSVGRMGTEQKATDVLLMAFREAAERIPGWKLKLVGSMEKAFQPYYESFLEKNPDLRDRIIWTGRIDDKEVLEETYRKAKIFVLTSTFEGGTPNVWAEAARNNCYMLMSDFDASAEATGFGECGKIFSVGDYHQLSKYFVEICNDKRRLQEGCRRIREFHDRFFLYDKAIIKLDTLMKHIS